MSGCLTVVIREEDGNVHTLLKWSGSISRIIHHPHFLNKEKRWLKEYINEGHYLYEDDPDFEWSGKPAEYGIVVIDWVNDKIINCNMQTSIGSVIANQFCVWNCKVPDNYTYKVLFDTGKVKGFIFEGLSTDGVNPYTVEFDPKIDTYYKLCDENHALNESGQIISFDHMPAIWLDMDPFEVIQIPFNDCIVAANKVQEEMKKLGLDVNEKAWNDYREEWENNYAESEGTL